MIHSFTKTGILAMALAVMPQAMTAAPLAKKADPVAAPRAFAAMTLDAVPSPLTAVRHRSAGDVSPFKTASDGAHAPLRVAPRRSAALDGMTVNGCLTFCNTIDGDQYGMYNLNLTTGVPTVEDNLLRLGINALWGGAEVGDRYYACWAYDNEATWEMATFVNAYDTSTWELLSVKPVGEGMRAYDVAYDPTTDRVYGVFFTDDCLYIAFGYADYATGQRTIIQKYTSPDISGVACTPEGQIYMVSNKGQLYSVDKATGDRTPIGNTNSLHVSFMTSAFINPDNGKLYFGQVDRSSSVLYEYDLTTGDATPVLQFPGGDEYCGMYVPRESVVQSAVPAKVADLSVEAAADGALTATVTFTAPSTDANGDPLAELTKIEIKRDDVLIHTITGVAPGVPCTYTDTDVPANGRHDYTVIPYNSAGAGVAAHCEVRVGLNEPAPIEYLNVVENSYGNVTLTWNAVTTDLDGHPYPAPVTYDLYVVEGGFPYVIADGITSPSYTYTAVEEGKQAFMQWAVAANNGTEIGEGCLSALLPIGTPYAAPFRESFAGGKVHHDFASTAEGIKLQICGDEYFTDLTSCDLDGGYLMMSGEQAGAFGGLTSGKVEVPAGAVLTFRTLAVADDDINEFAVAVIADGQTTQLATIPVNTVAGAMEWGKASVSLAQYGGKTVQFVIVGTLRKYGTMLIDNVVIKQELDHDLAVSDVEAPATVHPGEEFAVSATVTNFGASTADAYTVELHLNGNLKVAEIAGTPLASDVSNVVTFHQTLISLHGGENTLTVKVVGAGDGNDANNSSDAVVTLVQNRHPAVSNINGVKNDDGSYTLTWDAPDLSGSYVDEVFEDFEDAPSWAKEYDGWTFVDLDQKAVGGFQGLEIPGMVIGQDMSRFFIFDREVAGVNDTFDGHSGAKYLAALYNYRDLPLDDWAISPLLSGDAQTISFYARSYSEVDAETIEVYYSTGSLDPSEFILIERYEDLPALFRRIEVDLPAGARHFAVRTCATGSFMLILDDFTFTRECDFSSLTLEGYNIYRNGVKMHTDVHPSPSFTDMEFPEGIHYYHVTALYNKGESTAVLHTATSSIEGIEADSVVDPADAATPAIYYNLRGIRIPSPQRGTPCIRVTGATASKQL